MQWQLKGGSMLKKSPLSHEAIDSRQAVTGIKLGTVCICSTFDVLL